MIDTFGETLSDMQATLEREAELTTTELSDLNQAWMAMVREISEKRHRLVGLLKDRQVAIYRQAGGLLWLRDGYSATHACEIVGSNAKSLCGTLLTHAANVQPGEPGRTGKPLGECRRCRTILEKRGETPSYPESVFGSRYA